MINIAKYVYLHVEGRYISICCYSHKILTILHQISDNMLKIPIMFPSQKIKKKGNVDQLPFL